MAPFLEPRKEGVHAIAQAGVAGEIIVSAHAQVLFDSQVGKDPTSLRHQRQPAAYNLVGLAA